MSHKEKISELVKAAIDAKREYSALQLAISEEIDKNYKEGESEVIPTDIVSDPGKSGGVPLSVRVEKKGKGSRFCSFVLVKP